MKLRFTSILLILLIGCFTFFNSCSSGGGGGGDEDTTKTGALIIDNAPAGTAVIGVLNYNGSVINAEQLTLAISSGASLAANTGNTPSVDLMVPTGGKFSQSGVFLVQVMVGTEIRYFDRVAFTNGGARIDWTVNYYDSMKGEYVAGQSTPASSSSAAQIVSGALTVSNAAAGNYNITVFNFSGPVTTTEQFSAAGATMAALTTPAMGAGITQPIQLSAATGGGFNQTGFFLVQVIIGQSSIRYFDKVVFANGGAVIDWNKNYYDALTQSYVTGDVTPGNSSSSNQDNPNPGTSSSGGTSSSSQGTVADPNLIWDTSMKMETIGGGGWYGSSNFWSDVYFYDLDQFEFNIDPESVTNWDGRIKFDLEYESTTEGGWAVAGFSWNFAGTVEPIGDHTGICLDYALSGTGTYYLQINTGEYTGYKEYRISLPKQSLGKKLFTFANFTQNTPCGSKCYTLAQVKSQAIGMQVHTEVTVSTGFAEAELGIKSVRWDSCD